MKKSTMSFMIVVALLLLTGRLFAHHGRGATYDMQKEVALKGTIAEVMWRNPHIAIFVDVKDDTGKVVRWAIEHSNITTLAMQGYGRTTLKVGDQVTAVVRPGANGTPIGLCVKFIMADGREIFQRGAGVD
jgi:hypothetical protein